MNGDGSAENGGGQVPLFEQFRKGKISYEQYQQGMKAQETAQRERSGRIHSQLMEHVDPEQAAKEARARARNHPTHGSTRELPDRWTSAGYVAQPGEEDKT